MKLSFGAGGEHMIRCSVDNISLVAGAMATNASDDALRKLGELSYGSGYSDEFDTEGYCYSEYVNVASEYRLIAFRNGDILAINRPVTNRWYSNVALNQPSQSDTSWEKLAPDYNTVCDKLLAKFPECPWLAIDFYVTGDGKLGVFEFSQQFGYATIGHEIANIKQSMYKSLLTYL